MSARSGYDPRHFVRGQWPHALLLIVLVYLAWYFHQREQPAATRTLLGLGNEGWFVLAIAIPIVHQVFVWFVWRSELCYSTFTSLLGRRAFTTYQFLFLVLLFARPLSIACLAIVDRNSLALTPTTRVMWCVVLGLPAAYTGYSVVRYFGIARAVGADHFEERYRELPLVAAGMFKYSSNAMYRFAFLFLWMIAIAAASRQALIAAAFSHAYIWVHYYCTERPDMQLIYGNCDKSAQGGTPLQ